MAPPKTPFALPVPSNECKPSLDGVPAELREMIYQETFSALPPQAILNTVPYIPVHPLLQTNQLLRREATSYYLSNLILKTKYLSRFKAMAKNISYECLSMIKEIRLLEFDCTSWDLFEISSLPLEAEQICLGSGLRSGVLKIPVALEEEVDGFSGRGTIVWMFIAEVQAEINKVLAKPVTPRVNHVGTDSDWITLMEKKEEEHDESKKTMRDEDVWEDE